jgi:hypothetical protein
MLVKGESALVRLTEEQERVATLVAEGRVVSEVAMEVEIDAATVARWRRDPRFVAEVNRRRQEAWASVHDRLRGMVSKAVDALEEAVDQGDVGAAVELLKAAGVYGRVPAPAGEVDPELLLVRQAEAWAANEYAKEEAVADRDERTVLVLNDRKAQLTRKRLEELKAQQAG